MERPNLKIIGIEAGRIPAPRTRKYSQENHRRIYSNLKKKMPINTQEGYRTPIRLYQNRKHSYQIIIKTQNL